MLIHRKTFPHHLRYYFYLNIELILKIDGVNEENMITKESCILAVCTVCLLIIITQLNLIAIPY